MIFFTTRNSILTVLTPIFFLCSVLLSTAHAQSLKISDSWMRPTRGNMGMSAAYMKIHNHGDNDRTLTQVKWPSNSPIQSDLQLHITRKQQGVYSMVHQKDGIILPARLETHFAPKGAHIMILNASGSIEVNNSLELILVFDQDEEIRVNFTIR